LDPQCIFDSIIDVNIIYITYEGPSILTTKGGRIERSIRALYMAIDASSDGDAQL